MKIWEKALPLELQASRPNHNHQHPTIPVGMWQSLKTTLRNQTLKSDQTKASLSPSESPPSTPVPVLITGVQRLEDTFRIAIEFGAWLNILGLGAKDVSAERRIPVHGCTIKHSEWHSSLATLIMTDICSQRYKLRNRVRICGFIFGFKLQWQTAHPDHLLYKM